MSIRNSLFKKYEDCDKIPLCKMLLFPVERCTVQDWQASLEYTDRSWRLENNYMGELNDEYETEYRDGIG